MKQLPRLINYAVHLQDRTPIIPYPLRRFIPQVDIVEACRNGLHAASEHLGVNVAQLQSLVEQGEEEWEFPTPHAFRLAIANAVLDNESLNELPLEKRIDILETLAQFTKMAEASMIDSEDIDLGQLREFHDIPKFDSGYEPIDVVTGGLYQGLVMLMGNPGTGKTSQMLSIAESMKRKYPAKRVLFFEQEIPGRLMTGRMRPIFERGNPFEPEVDFLYTNKSLSEILKICEANKDGEQIIFIDSPDAMTGPGAAAVDGGRRFDLENIYRNMVKVKSMSTLVFVASQPKANQATLTIGSGAEAWSKAWYVDIMLGFTKMGNTGKLKMKTLKNRFGIPDLEVVYQYDYEKLLASNIIEIDLEANWDFPGTRDD